MDAGIRLAPEVDKHQQELHQMRDQLSSKLQNVIDDTQALKAAWGSDASDQFQGLAGHLQDECQEAIRHMDRIITTADDQIEKLKQGAGDLG
ncbi:hypothetical protein [Mycobacteroides abscessus]|uniref:hypothetical protein n=1 Tax=Mycobacteroides abscessus TaxID=36809 RepID=UPI0002585BA5|nr:hypothetical protein [Mycobacteroides abscessus]AMU73860.1 hypothetical protein A3O06_03645 [Mycobacteroides abscessus]ANO22797.1 hypothetical protein BAB79_03645 [Mycobacteroides abscessus]EIC62606.1 hypothetical protein OUW_21874 [Mycobacteroides abscessus M93]MBN7442437.1 hypothetical protein [Mycobacteroides abscessus subsp. abscessus]MBN7482853.1 hypothetical protein [Mycobacteroides abscessus subsp. massiliense]